MKKDRSKIGAYLWMSALLAAPCPGQAGNEAETIPARQLRALEKPFLDLVAVGRKREAEDLLAILTELGHAEKALASLDRRQKRVREITRDPERRIPFRSSTVLSGMGHLHLANHPDVYRAIKEQIG